MSLENRLTKLEQRAKRGDTPPCCVLFEDAAAFAAKQAANRGY